MKIAAAIIFCLCITTASAQDTTQPFDGHKWQAPYHLPEPANWGIERFLIPISFAPQIAYKGVEDIRFSPGWAKKASDEYWSYAFLWYLDGNVKMKVKTIENNLKNYYTGLTKVNRPDIPADQLITVTASFKKIKKTGDDEETYTGSVNMQDYMTQKPITLNAKVHVRSCAGADKTFIFYELSPQPLSHQVWNDLDQLWVDFKCKKD